LTFVDQLTTHTWARRLVGHGF